MRAHAKKTAASNCANIVNAPTYDQSSPHIQIFHVMYVMNYHKGRHCCICPCTLHCTLVVELQKGFHSEGLFDPFTDNRRALQLGLVGGLPRVHELDRMFRNGEAWQFRDFEAQQQGSHEGGDKVAAAPATYADIVQPRSQQEDQFLRYKVIP